VQALWEQGGWATAQCVALCAADESELLSESEKPLWEDLQWVKGVLGQRRAKEMQQAETWLRQNDWDALVGPMAELRDPLSRDVIQKAHSKLGILLDKVDRKDAEFREAVALCTYVVGSEFKQQKQLVLKNIADAEAEELAAKEVEELLDDNLQMQKEHAQSGPTGSLSFMEAISVCMRKYFTFSGRARRSEYWWFVLFSTILNLATFFVLGEGALNIVQWAFTLPSWAVFCRRLHDTNHSGWWWLIAFTIIGIIPLFIWLCREGDETSNEFGPPP
jgi:uncharacterized membrane protein YhaH (DUF805 family)